MGLRTHVEAMKDKISCLIKTRIVVTFVASEGVETGMG